MNLQGIKSQSGYVLLLTVLAFMGIGGVVLAGFTQDVKKEVDHQRFLHNNRVLAEAKQALLFYAYNYAVISGGSQGPGRLPCPDVDNDGDQDTGFGECDAIGRLAWAEPGLHLYDIRDADGQRLWYAVSDSFAAVTSGGNTINSDADGIVTVRDQAGKFFFNGSVPEAIDGRATGVAAVIIAPGRITERNGVTQDRSVANGDDPFDHTEAPDNTDRDTDPGIIDAVNYLDQYFGIEDNAALAQGGTNGFILGPIDDLAADSIRVNDQIIVITAAEVVAYAEKAALNAYRNALLAYDQRVDTDVAAGDHYPWLFDYSVNEKNGGYPDITDFPSNPSFVTEKGSLGRFGRVPSMYTRYFTETNGQPIESRLNISLNLVYPVTPVVFNPALPIAADTPSDVFDPVTPDLWINSTTASPLTGVRFEDVPDVFSANDGRLIGSVVANQTFTHGPKYYWDEKPVGDGWILCAGGGNQPEDCRRNGAGINLAGLPSNDTPSQVLKVQLDVELQPAPVTSATISFSNVDPDTINDAGNGLGNFKVGDLVGIEGSGSNDGVYLVANVAAGSLTLDAAEELATEIAGATVTVSKVIPFVIDYSTPLASTITGAADTNQHAIITTNIAGGRVDPATLPAVVSYDYDSNYDASFDIEASGTLALANLLTGGSLSLSMRFYPELPDWIFDDGWYEAIMMAYANDYRPDVATGPCTPGTDCLVVNNSNGTNNNKISILVIGREHDWNDDAAAGLVDDLGDIFDLENRDFNDIFDARVLGGNDRIMVIEEI